ncbi:MAG: metallophosphoesterase [Treponema sp.]|jgi:3',5'-cyclic AMP phosphodiesterase CpdA|nr:metallophosphoesterase [Treponema sp.]
MVKFPPIPWALCFLLLSGCNVDILGLFGSTGFDERFRERDTFNFLTGAELRPSFSAPYSFIVLSDTHIEEGNARGLERIADTVRGANAGGENIRFAVITGDITQNGRRQDLEKFLEIAESLRSLAVPLYPVIGNHDIYSGNWSQWRELIGSSAYYVESPDTTLIMLDSANANFGRDQLDWLEDRLRGAKKNTFVFTHANLFTESMGDVEMLTDTRERARLLSMLRGRCAAVFAGHVHSRIIRHAGGVWYVTQEDFKGHSNYCLVRVDAAGGISWEFRKL